MQRRFYPHIPPREVPELRPSDIAAIGRLDETDEILGTGDTAGSNVVREFTDEERERVYSKRGKGDRPRVAKLRAVK